MDSGVFSRRSRTCNTHLAVRGLPPNIDEQSLCEIFSKFGEVQSCSILPCHQHSDTNEALVVFFSALHAQEAALALNGAPTSRGILEISALPASPGSADGQQEPCDNIYIRQLPAHWTEKDLRDIFAPFGTVVECRILNRGDNTRCAGALVRMHSIAAASQAIVALNGFCPQSTSGDYSSMPLLVRFADSPEEKARKQARRDQNLFRQNRSLDLPPGPICLNDLPYAHDTRRNSLGALDPETITDSIQAGLTSRAMQSNGGHADLSINNLLSMMYPATPFTNIHTKLPSEAQKACEMSPRKNTDQQTAPPLAASYTSLYVKNCPPEADDLWVYERFSPYGAVLSVKVLHEEESKRCRGICFVNYTDLQGALNAIQHLNGRKVADKHLHVSLQKPRGRV